MLEYNKGKKEKMEYKIIECDSLRKLEKYVNQYKEYRPSGGITIRKRMGINMYIQVIYKEDKK